MTKLTVIARFNENLDWVKELTIPHLIYNKGNEINIPDMPSLSVPNVGREGDTWLRFIIKFYNHLPDITFLLQGDPFYHYPSTIETVNTYSKDELLMLGNKHISNEYGCPDHCGLTVRLMHNTVVQKHKYKQEYIFAAGAQYAVPKSLITNKSLDWWNRAYRLYISNKDSPWIFERLWIDIFNHKENQSI